MLFRSVLCITGNGLKTLDAVVGHVGQTREIKPSLREFEAMLDVFAANDQLCNQLGRNGQRYVQQNYTWSAVLKRFENALQLWS